MAKLVPKPIKTVLHSILSKDIEQIPETYLKHKLTPKEYVGLMSGAYGHKYDMEKISDKLKNHPLNNEANNSKVLSNLIRHKDWLKSNNDEEKEGAIGSYHSQAALRELLNQHQLPKKDISKLLNVNRTDANGEEYIKPEWLENQKNLSKEHLLGIASDPKQELSDLLKHPAADRDVAKALITHKANKLSSNQINTLLGSMHHEDPSKRLIDAKDVEKMILDNEIGKENVPHPELHRMLDALDPEPRKKIMDKLLGIEGGQHINEPEDVNNPDEFGYDNWAKGEGYDRHKARVIAESKHLTPDQIDHIKRHGDIDQKYSLFHNPHIDKKHADEMYENWISDDRDKNYSLEGLQEKIREEYPYSDRYDKYDEDARDAVQEDYPMSEYLDDAYGGSDGLLKAADGFDSEDWINQYLKEKFNVTDSSDADQELRKEAEKAMEARVEAIKADPAEEIGDEVYDGYDDATRDAISDKSEKMYDEEMENAHENPEFLPKHLSSVDEIMRRKKEREENEARDKAKEEERKDSGFLDRSIPNREHVHEYGDMQHHVEMAKDYADANGGSIDIGHLNKLYPNLKDKWKQIFGGKGKISSQELEQKKQELPKTKYDISHKKWGSGLQNLNERDQAIFRLDHSPESLAPLKADPEAHNVFNRISDVSRRSGHPTNANTIAWARVDTNDPKHWMIDEVQSDFGSAARDYLHEHGKTDEAAAVEKVIQHHKNWREALINHVINEAKRHGVQKVSTHSPESKAAHTGSSKIHTVYKDSYQKVPRGMGFRPSEYTSLPLTDEGKATFLTSRGGTGTDELMRLHLGGLQEHAKQWLSHSMLRANPEDKALTPAHTDLAAHHYDMYQKHQNRLSQLDPSNEYRNVKMPGPFLQRNNYNENHYDFPVETSNAKEMAQNFHNKEAKLPIYGFDSALNEEPKMQEGHQGHTYDLSPEAFKKSLLETYDLMKAEIDQSTKSKVALTLKTMQDNKQILDQIKQSNPEAYQALTQLIQSMIEIFKRKTGEDPQNLVHELEIQEELQAQQEQMEQQGQAPQDPSQGPHSSPKDEKLHGRQMVYAPGSIRRYSSEDERIKSPEGDWQAFKGGLQDPSEGQQQ